MNAEGEKNLQQKKKTPTGYVITCVCAEVEKLIWEHFFFFF